MPEVTLDDVTLAYDVAGDGDPVVLICGCGGPAVGWFGITPGLVAAGYQVVTFDNRGMAPSSSPPAPYTIDQMVRDTLGLCDHLGIARARFAGHSMGGWIAEVLAAEHCERVEAAVMMGSCNETTSWERAVTLAQRDLARIDGELPSSLATLEVLHYLPNHELMDDEVVETWVAMVTEGEPWTNPGRLGQYEACLGWYDDDEKHAAARATIGVPCLVMAFEHDIDSPPPRARVAAAQIPAAQFVEIIGASHLGPYTHPEAVTDQLTEFFASQ